MWANSSIASSSVQWRRNTPIGVLQMGKHVGKPVTVWFDIDTLNQLDLHLEKLAADCPGMKPSRSAFIQLAVMRSLAGRGEPAERPAREVEINYSGPDAERALKEAQAAFNEALGKQGNAGSRV